MSEETAKVTKKQKELEESIISLKDFISTYLRMTFTNDIVDIAQKSGVGKHLPSNLKEWSNYDFHYDHSVYWFLIEVFKNEDSDTIEILLQNIIIELKKFQMCLKYDKDCQVPKDEKYDDSFCYECDKFRDNKSIKILNKSLNVLGFNIDEEGYVQRISSKTMDIAKDIEKVKERVPSEDIDNFLSKDVQQKGQQMAEAYLYLYSVENCLRSFLEITLKNELGDDWESKINISNPVKRKVDGRKEDEEKNKWLPIRGDSIFFYMDFEELGKIIINNWEIFKKYFPSTEFITTKMTEMYDCRNRIAHNSYISKENKELIQLYFKQILSQMNL